MSSFEEQELKKLENALSGLTPRPAQFDRDGLLYEAGRRSVRPNRLWLWSTVVMTSVAGLLGFLLVLHAARPAQPTSHRMDVKRPMPGGPLQVAPAPLPQPATAPAESDDERDLPPSGSAIP